MATNTYNPNTQEAEAGESRSYYQQIDFVPFHAECLRTSRTMVNVSVEDEHTCSWRKPSTFTIKCGVGDVIFIAMLSPFIPSHSTWSNALAPSTCMPWFLSFPHSVNMVDYTNFQTKPTLHPQIPQMKRL
jgi:hypothetical protein